VARTIRNLIWSAGKHAKAAESLGLEALHAGLERRGRRGAAERVGELGLRRERHVQRELRRNNYCEHKDNA
jgi:hypothetical protein